jgi:hypothetical protein
MKITNQNGRKALFWSCAAILVAMQLTASAQTLVNRYSFSDVDNGSGNIGASVADSVGGPNWNGTLPNGGTLAGGQLSLAAGSSQYVQLPAGILSNYTAVTIDAWATFGTLPVNCFFYGFGNTDGGGAGENYIFCAPQGGRIAITAADPGWTAEQGTGGAGNLSGLTVHVTSVYNPVLGYEELYTNGVLVSANNGVTAPMSSVSSVLNYIGRSLYNADPYPDLSLDEFRIWNGALNPLQVAGSDLSGPDTVGTDPGAVTSIQLQIPLFQLTQGGHESAAVSATTAAFPNPINITRLSTFTSGNTNILTVNSNGVIAAVGQGSATVIARYGSLSSTQTMTVVQPVSILAHRYSFSDVDNGTGNVGASVADSAGGAAWNGTLLNGGTLAGGQLSLAAASSQYVQLPAGIISNYAAVTIEAWATFPDALPGNCFFWGFGNTDGGGAGEDYIYLQPSAGHIGITGSDPGWAGPEQLATGYGNLSSKTNVHITAVFNPQAGWVAVYTNGVLVGKNTAVTWQLSSVSSVLNYIAKSLYNDPYMDVNVDEFRIYNGALTSQGIAISDAAGTGSIPSGVTNGPGALLSLTIQAPATLQPLQAGSLKLLANYASLTNWDIIGNSIFQPAGLTVSTSDTNVLVFGADSLLHGVNAGTASVITVYQGTTNTVSVTVAQAAPATLAHRYSFTSDASDSVGGSAWNGTLPNGGTFANAQVSLAASGSQYVQLPAGVISNYNAVAIEAWATFPDALPGACFFWGFGNTDSGGAGENYIYLQPSAGHIGITGYDPGWQGPEQTAGTYGNLSSKTNVHITAVFNPPAGYIAVYTNGTLAGLNTAVTWQLSSVSSVLNYIGKSLYNDPYMDVNVDEFRIYNGVLSPNDVKATDLLGPNQVLAANASVSIATSGSNAVLSWPAAAGAYSLQSRTSLTSGAWTTIASPVAQLVGSQWQVTVPNSGGSKFYRLAR